MIKFDKNKDESLFNFQTSDVLKLSDSFDNLCSLVDNPPPPSSPRSTDTASSTTNRHSAPPSSERPTTLLSEEDRVNHNTVAESNDAEGTNYSLFLLLKW